MDCHEARRLLDQDALSAASGARQTTLAVHLASCSACRTYRSQMEEQQFLGTLLAQDLPPRRRTHRSQMEEQQLLGMLLAQVPPARHVPVQRPRAVTRRHAPHSLRTAGVSLLVGSVIALSPTNGMTAVLAAQPESPLHTAPALPHSDILRSSEQSVATTTTFAFAGDAALRSDILRSMDHQAAEVVASEAEISLANVDGLAAAPAVYAGQELVIPALPQALIHSDILRSRMGQQTAAASLENSAALLAAPPIYAGQELVIPALPDAVTSAAPALTDASQPTPGSTYTVQSGDTLSGIAQRAYGNAYLWTVIYEANRGVIGGHPDLIYPGQQLSIPQAPQQPVPPPQTGQGMGMYTVQSGDTLSAIAQRAYGNAYLWTVIYEANRGVIGGHPGLIYPGQQLSVPSVSQPVPQPPVGQGPGQYTVQSGDTLSGIAQYAYGNASLWPAIYQANQGVIGGDPGLIYPGQVLTIPAL